MSQKKLRKSVESIQQQIFRHYKKLAAEASKRSTDATLMNYWQQEIAGLEASLERAEQHLRRSDDFQYRETIDG